jgi:hypothetical protein
MATTKGRGERMHDNKTRGGYESIISARKENYLKKKQAQQNSKENGNI